MPGQSPTELGWVRPDRRVPEIPIVEHVTAAEITQARRVVAARAKDPADARLLLEALGLAGGAS